MDENNESPARGPRPAAGGSPDSAPQIDPVCGMTVDPARTSLKSDHDGRTFFFCNPG